MARRYKNYARRAYGGARRGYSAMGRSYGSKMGVNISPAFVAGFLIGMTDLDQKIPGQAVLAGAVAPVRGLGVIKGGCQGIIAGNLVQSIRAGGLSSAGFVGV